MSSSEHKAPAPLTAAALIIGVTVKLTSVVWPPDPFAVMLSLPPGAVGMVMLEVQIPWLLALDSTATKLSPSRIVIRSRDLAAAPVTLTTVPGGPLSGSSLRAPRTVILAWRMSLPRVVEPVARIVWEPPVATGT